MCQAMIEARAMHRSWIGWVGGGEPGPLPREVVGYTRTLTAAHMIMQTAKHCITTSECTASLYAVGSVSWQLRTGSGTRWRQSPMPPGPSAHRLARRPRTVLHIFQQGGAEAHVAAAHVVQRLDAAHLVLHGSRFTGEGGLKVGGTDVSGMGPE